MAPLNEGINFLKSALSHPRIRKLVTDNVSKYLKKNTSAASAGAGAAAASNNNYNNNNSSASQEQWKSYEKYQQSHPQGGSSSSGNNNTNNNNSGGGSTAGFFKNFDWFSFREKALQFIVVNFMGVIMVFQIFSGFYNKYQKDKQLNEKRRVQEARAYEQRGLVVEQMQQTQKLSQQLVSAQKSGSGGTTERAKMSDNQTAALMARQQELNHKIHEVSVAAVYQPISGVGVAEVSGFDHGGGSYTADIPVQVWIHDLRVGKEGEMSEKPIVPFDPLLRWQGYGVEIRDRSYDPLTGLKGIAELKFNY